MFNAKKIIPSLAAGVLALTGCGDDGGGNGGNGGNGGAGGDGGAGGGTPSALTGALGDWCMKLAGCFPNSPYYQPTSDCIDIHLDYYDLEGNISGACETAATNYFECGADLDCDEFLLYSNDCDAEWDAAIDECPSWL